MSLYELNSKLMIYKIVVFVPAENADYLRKVMGDAGAGRLGKYSHASFSSKGVGRFIPLKDANPAAGTIGKLESVDEERIETIVEKDKLKKVVEIIKKNHPYEEVALDVYQIVSPEDLTKL